MVQKFWQSKMFWISVAALIAWASKTVWGVNIDAQINSFLDVAFPVVAFLGVANNPTNATGFGANTGGSTK